jgi:hypothetical protein
LRRSLVVSIGGVVVAFLAAHLAYGKEWRGITPLRSTRADVVRILGQSKGPGDLYNLANETVLITYSNGMCREGGVWNVPRDTVVRITISPKKPVAIRELNLDLKEYERITDKHLPGIIYYNNAKEGVHIQTLEDKVTSIHYLPSSDNNVLRCGGSTVSPPVTKNGQILDSHLLFDSYGELPFSKEKQHLDLFGAMLKRVVGARGYIVVYVRDAITIRSALRRANRAKTYLRQHYQIKANSIEIIKGAAREDFVMELYLVG